MQRLTRREGLDLRAPRSQRSSSISNDRASLSVASLPFPPAVQPDPAYIAPSSASQIVTGDQEPALDEEVDEEGMDGMGAMNAWVAPNALSLVNAFLDQLLFSFLASSRSTSIASLRPAVSEVLKPRLAKDAIACADAELQEFLGGEDGDESVFQHGLEPRGQWDLHTIWRRTRLRCMVYTRLGDLEEEDEEMWIEREDLDLDYRTDSRNRLSRDLGVVSPAAAIFLTSILEFIGEEILRVAGKAAYTRLEARRRQEKHTPEQAIDLGRLSVEVVDIEKLAANTTFGRLWRSWKKKVRSPSITSQRPSSRELLRRPASSMSSSEPRSRKASVGESGVHVADAGAFQRPSTAEDRERTFEAAAVPLPVTRDDASEIEGRPPATWASPAGSAERPRSMGMGYGSYQSANVMNADCSGDTLHSRPRLLQHHRSSSLPHLTSKQSPSAHISRFSTPRDDPSLVALQDSPRGYSHDDSDPPAVATIDDGVIEHDGGAARVGEKEAAEQSDMAAYEQEMRDIDAGLDSLAKASNEHQAIDKQAPSSTISNNDDRRGQDRWPVSERVAVRGSGAATKLSQQLPLSSMQGYAKENASLDKREASVVEPIPSQVFGNKGLISQGVSDETASHYREDENTPAELRDLFSYAGNDQFGGATSTIRDINTRNYGSVHRSHPDANANTVRSSSPTFAQAKGPAVSGIRKQLPPVSTGVERAAVQRVSASPVSPMESPFGRTSTSSNRELRALHKSSSSASHRAAKLKGLVGIQSSDTNRQSAVSRTSSDGSASIAVRTPKRDETQQSFEDLIKSDETIQYTLTPPTVRDIDSIDSPRVSHSRTGTVDSIRTSGPAPSIEMNPPSKSRSIVSLEGLDGLRSNPAANSILEEPQIQTQRSRSTTARSPGAPRDAQMNTETTRDFADFIRSTGPEGRAGLSQRDGAMSPPASKSRSDRAMTPNQRSVSGTSTGKKITKTNPSLSRSPPPVASNPPAKRTISKLQAREATYEPTHNEDLLDFLRQGPSDDRGIDTRPTPRPVASVVPQNPRVASNLRSRISNNTRSSVASTHDSSFADKSVRSTDSRTGLLDSPQGQNNFSPPLSQRQTPFGEPPHQSRKQRRVKNPYAIDTDSEDGDHSVTPKPHRQRQGQAESLLDFLHSTPQPGDNPRIPSAFDDLPDLPGHNSRSNGNMTKITSNQPRARAAATPGVRPAAAAAAAAQAPTTHPQREPPRGRPANAGQPPQLPPLNSRDISPHLLASPTYPSTSTTVPSNNSNYQPRSTHNGAAARIRPPGVARPEREPERGMSDLADFLRNSEPPTQMPQEVMGGRKGRDEAEEKEEKGHGVWGRLKGRGRKGGGGVR